MSQVVDQFLLEQMRKEDDNELMYGGVIGEEVMDCLCGYDEESNTYDPDQGLLFPQPITKIDL